MAAADDCLERARKRLCRIANGEGANLLQLFKVAHELDEPSYPGASPTIPVPMQVLHAALSRPDIDKNVMQVILRSYTTAALLQEQKEAGATSRSLSALDEGIQRLHSGLTAARHVLQARPRVQPPDLNPDLPEVLPRENYRAPLGASTWGCTASHEWAASDSWLQSGSRGEPAEACVGGARELKEADARAAAERLLTYLSDPGTVWKAWLAGQLSLHTSPDTPSCLNMQDAPAAPAPASREDDPISFPAAALHYDSAREDQQTCWLLRMLLPGGAARCNSRQHVEADRKLPDPPSATAQQRALFAAQRDTEAPGSGPQQQPSPQGRLLVELLSLKLLAGLGAHPLVAASRGKPNLGRDAVTAAAATAAAAAAAGIATSSGAAAAAATHAASAAAATDSVACTATMAATSVASTAAAAATITAPSTAAAAAASSTAASTAAATATATAAPPSAAAASILLLNLLKTEPRLWLSLQPELAGVLLSKGSECSSAQAPRTEQALEELQRSPCSDKATSIASCCCCRVMAELRDVFVCVCVQISARSSDPDCEREDVRAESCELPDSHQHEWGCSCASGGLTAPAAARDGTWPDLVLQPDAAACPGFEGCPSGCRETGSRLVDPREVWGCSCASEGMRAPAAVREAWMARVCGCMRARGHDPVPGLEALLQRMPDQGR